MSDPKPKPRLRLVSRKRRACACGRAAPCGCAPSAKQTSSSTTVARPKVFRAQPRMANQVPDEILHDPKLNALINETLPHNYSFEIHKSVYRLRTVGARCVALQFPEGLLAYACVISDILREFAHVDTVIMGDVTYGACCIDDFTARRLGCDFLIHYGHSCLVPIGVTGGDDGMMVQYVFVDIKFDVDHFVRTIEKNVPADEQLALISTVQFAASLQAARPALARTYTSLRVPQCRPLSPGEVLGCTSPTLPPGTTTLVYVGDGRFHLESCMIANPEVRALRYEPYSRVLSHETYDHAEMRRIRRSACEQAARARRVGVILGTLGRQGNERIVRHVQAMLDARGVEHFLILLSEVFPAKLALMSGDADAWVQVACPRLSIDWGYAFDKPLLSSYEADVAFGGTDFLEQYPMDFYASDGGRWSNYHPQNKRK